MLRAMFVHTSLMCRGPQEKGVECLAMHMQVRYNMAPSALTCSKLEIIVAVPK